MECGERSMWPLLNVAYAMTYTAGIDVFVEAVSQASHATNPTTTSERTTLLTGGITAPAQGILWCTL